MVRVITSLFKSLSVWTIKQIISGIRFATPWAIRMMIAILGVMLRVSMIAIISGFAGVTPVAHRVAEIWTLRAIGGGFPYLWELKLLQFFYRLALFTIFVGWVILLFTGAFTLDVVFNWMF